MKEQSDRHFSGILLRVLPAPLRERLSAGRGDAHKRELVKGSLVSFLLKAFGMVLGYAFTMLITRTYGAHTMGVFTLFITVLNIVSIVGRLGFDTALLKFIAEYSSRDRMDLARDVYLKSIKAIIPFGLCLSLLLYLASPHIAARLFGKGYLGPYFQMASFVVVPFSLLFINAESLRGLKKIKEYSFVQDMAISLLATALLALSFLFTREVLMPFVVYLVSVFGAFALSLFLWLRRIPPVPGHTGEKVELKAVLHVSLPILVSGSLYLFMGWVDKIILGIYASESDVGIYNIALKVSTLTSLSLLAVNSIAAPKFAQCYGSGDTEGLRTIAQQSTRLIFWSSVPVLALFFFFPSFTLGLFGMEFRAGAPALLLLTFGQFINAVSGSVGYLLQMTGRQKVFQNVMLLTVIINLTLNLTLVPRYGLNGAAFATMCSVILLNAIPFFLIRFYYGFFTFSPAVVFNLKKRR
ncbi:MAG: flippase [Alphaproteobacteria bacterium]|uniref:Flippase n=1 Tax=Candidatus Nitrobium versatile TaxID=2884831 RepID=A0A953M3S4_9BACT|nr:flippase [Candidatus Nitrobium versatile]